MIDDRRRARNEITMCRAIGDERIRVHVADEMRNHCVAVIDEIGACGGSRDERQKRYRRRGQPACELPHRREILELSIR